MLRLDEKKTQQHCPLLYKTFSSSTLFLQKFPNPSLTHKHTIVINTYVHKCKQHIQISIYAHISVPKYLAKY